MDFNVDWEPITSDIGAFGGAVSPVAYDAPEPSFLDNILGGLGKGILGSLKGSERSSAPGGSGGGSYADSTKSQMNELLRLALESFETPSSII